MLDTLRASATGLLAKLLLGLLVLMFGIWGIGDVIRNPSSKSTIATVGSETITSSDYIQAMRREAENLKQLMGANFSPDFLKDSVFSRHVLQQLINHALLKQESEALGLIPSDADVVNHIRTNPQFRDDKGNFDKKLFDGMLQAVHNSEKNYVEKLRQDMAISLLVDTLTAAAPVTNIAVHTLYDAREERRSLSFYLLKPTAVTNLPIPDSAQLKTYYDAHSHDFTAPEYRTVSYVTINNTNAGKEVKVTEDDLRAAYHERLDEFKHSERRVVKQLLYPSQESADKAAEMLKNGKDFEQVGKETDTINKGAFLLGKMERSSVIENAADKVFSLKTGQVTEPIQSPFGWHIFQVTSIEPPTVSTFEEVRPTIEKDMLLRGTDNALNKFVNNFQDALAGGNTLAEAAHDFGLTVVQVGPFDQKGKALDKAKPVKLPNLDRFVEVSFKTEDNSDSPMTGSKGGVYYMVHVDKVMPEHQLSLDEVLERVATAWQDEERQKRLGELAIEVAKQFASSSARSAVIEKYNLELATTAVIKHDTLSLGERALPAPLIADAFVHKPQETTAAYLAKGGNYMLATVNFIVPAPSPDKDPKMAETLKGIRGNLDNVGQNEILQEYAHSLAHKYSVSINENALQAVLK